MMSKSVSEVIATLREERGPLAERLDAIDLAIDNLSRVFGANGSQPSRREKPKRGKSARPEKRKRTRAPSDGGAAEERRQVLLALISKSEVGVTGRELKKATPKMDDHDRGNALQILKTKGQIRRAGNCWTVAA